MEIVGPDRPTLVERLLGALPLPFAVVCIIFGALIGPVGQYLAIYGDTGSFDEAFTRTILAAYGTNGALSLEVGVVGALLYTLTTFYLFFGIRYMRSRVAAAESTFSQLTQSKDAYRRAFGGVSRNWGPAVISIIFYAVFIPYALMSVGTGGAYFAAYGLLSTFAIGAAIGTLVWVYARSLWGLHRFGQEELQLKSFYEDRTLGLRPMGSLALSLAFSFFVVCALGILNVFIAPDPTSIVSVAGLTFFGTAMFVLPLNGIHRRMLSEKQGSQQRVRRDFARLVEDPEALGKGDPAAEMSEVRKLISYQLIEQKANSIASWPFDTGVVGRFTAILLSVTAILLSTIIREVLHF